MSETINFVTFCNLINNSNFNRLKELSFHKKENDDADGYIYDMHEKLREILTIYNDSLIGRCSICLE